MGYRIGIDIGKESTHGAIIEDETKIICRESIDTNIPITVEELEKKIGELIDLLLDSANIKSEEIEFVGISCPGIIDSKEKVAKYVCNFGWENERFSDFLEKKLGKPIYIDNDANMSVVGEYICSNLQNIKNMIFLIVDDGVGAGLILNGELYTGINYGAGEAGHMIINKGGRQCNCGNRGCFEKYVCATGITITGFELMTEYEDSLLRKYLKENGELTANAIFDAARQEDRAAIETVDIFTKDLAVGVANLVNLFQPEIIVIGGMVSQFADLFIDRLKERVTELDYAKNSDRRCDVTISKAGKDAGLIGAANIDKFINK